MIILKKTLIIILLILIPLIIFFNYSYPSDIKKLKTITMYDINNQEFYHMTKDYERTYIKAIPEEIKQSFISIEDKRFYQHHGFDFLRIIKTIITNRFKKSAGASTITQQLARMLFLNNEKSYSRKIKELFIALRLEVTYSKDDILTSYLNNLYFGHNIYGIYDASIFYFNKKPHELTLNEIAMLIGIVNGPSLYSPIIDYQASIKKKNIILEKLDKNAIKYNPKIYGIKQHLYSSGALFYKDIVINQLKKRDYYDIYTNFNPAITITDDESIVAIEPITGRVLFAGSGNYYESTYNKAIYSKRQMASTIKPFIYYEAINCGMTPLSKFLCTKESLQNSNYQPSNYNNKYEDNPITMLYALATSDNIYAVKTLEYLGFEKVNKVLSRLGLAGSNNLSLALGTNEQTLFEIASAYNVLAGLGIATPPYFIRQITKGKKIIYTHKQKPTKLLEYEASFIICNLMTFTFNLNISGKSQVTGASIANCLKHPYCGKSGSTLNDAYMLGFSKGITIGVWRGGNDLKDGGRVKKIWANLMNEQNKNDNPYEDDQIKKINANPTGFGKYTCEIYINEYLPRFQ